MEKRYGRAVWKSGTSRSGQYPARAAKQYVRYSANPKQQTKQAKVIKLNPNIKQHLTTALWVGAVLFVGVLLLSATQYRKSSKVAWTDIRIEPLLGGEYLVNRDDIQRTIATAFDDTLGGQPIALLNVARLERVLQSDPFLKTAEVHLSAQNVLQIEVSQREPVLRIMDDNGLNYYLDEEGIRMPTSPRHTARVVIATGELPPFDPGFRTEKDNSLNQTFQLAEYIRKDDFRRAMIEQIHVQNGNFTLIPKVGRQKILFGKYAQVEDKFKRLRAFYEQGMEVSGWRKYKEIDLRFGGQVIGRR